MTNSTPHSSAGTIAHIELPELEPHGATGPNLVASSAQLLASVKVDVMVVVGQAHTTVGHLLNLKEADIMRIDRGVDQPVDVVVNGVVVARGQLVVIDDSFGLRVTEVAPANKE